MKRRLKPKTLLKRFKTFCVICTRKIPRKRQRRRAITCKPDHQKLLTRLRKIERDNRQCSHCGRPSTPAEKSLFRQFRASLEAHHHPKNPKAAKGIRDAATATQKLSDIAYVVELGPKRRGAAKHRKGAAA
jgi:hypothetical protein